MGEVVIGDDDGIARAVALLAAGELVCFPTETVYGVGGNAADPLAVSRIFQAKGRPPSHPLIVHIADARDLAAWAGDIPPSALLLAELFWPGPLTMVLRRGPAVPLEVTGGQDTVAVRVPAHPLALRLLREFGGAVAAPSANRFGRVSPTRAEHVADELGDAVALILDGGPASVGLESTIVDLSEGEARLLRPGGIPRQALIEALGGEVADAGARAPRSPGRLASHYAPASPVEVLGPSEFTVRLAGAEEVSVMARRERRHGFVGEWVRLPDDPDGYARHLYASLRTLDRPGRPIIVEAPPRDARWEAVNDRLDRAASTQREGREGG